jgi:hypothetical protein
MPGGRPPFNVVFIGAGNIMFGQFRRLSITVKEARLSLTSSYPSPFSARKTKSI